MYLSIFSESYCKQHKIPQLKTKVVYAFLKNNQMSCCTKFSSEFSKPKKEILVNTKFSLKYFEARQGFYNFNIDWHFGLNFVLISNVILDFYHIDTFYFNVKLLAKGNH